MNTQIIQINKNENGKIQYLTEVLPMIPTNTILYKTLTGLGATYGELKADRNSIIIEPNAPVIVGGRYGLGSKDTTPAQMIPNIKRITCLEFMKVSIRKMSLSIWKNQQIREQKS